MNTGEKPLGQDKGEKQGKDRKKPYEGSDYKIKQEAQGTTRK